MGRPARTDKQRMIEILERQPEDSSYDELLRELAFERMIERGLADAEAERAIPHEEIGRRIVDRDK
jgi:predicted transcriptional regulator